MKKVLSCLLAIALLACMCSGFAASAEDMTQLIYSMDAGSRPTNYGVSAVSNFAAFVNLDDGAYNNVLRIYRVVGTASTQDRRTYFYLPSDIYTAYGTPKALTFEAKTDTGGLKVANTMSLGTGDPNWGSTVVNIDSFGSTWTKYTIDLTTGNGAAAVAANATCLSFASKFSSANTCNEFYFDNVSLVYEPAGTQYNVSLDGVTVKVDEGAEYTFPASTNAGFVAYTDGTDYYDAGNSVTVNENLSFTTVSIGAVTMGDGASMRLKAKSGMRFYTNINKDAIAAVRALSATVTMGTLIAPANLLDGAELTKALDEGVYADCAFSSDTYFADGSGFEGVVGSLVDIKDGNANRTFIGRGYVTVSLGGITKTIYAQYSSNDIANNSRTIAYIAKLLQQDVDAYNLLTPEQKTIVDAYASKSA